MYSTWRLVELKEELKRRGGKVTRKKADLIERLEFYDRNADYGNNSAQQASQPSQGLNIPAAETYHDINSSSILPNITKQSIQCYFDRFGKNIGQAKSLYESRYLLVARSSQSGQDTYLKGYCKAAMKQLQYEVNIKVSQAGMPEEATCECAAGEGTEAHCKHVGVLLLGAENMANQQIILLHEVSTSKLQTFHRPSKKYYATPLHASKLPSKRDVKNTVFSPYLLNNPQFDKMAYQSRFRNLILNFPHSTMPFKQLYAPANQHAVSLDHHYTAKSAVDRYLEEENLLNVSQEKILKIEQDTRGQSNNKNWHAIRKTHITASIFHTVCHLRPQTLESYSKQILNKTQIKTRAMAHGQVNEKVAIKKYMEMTHLDVIECGLFISAERPYLGASPDGLLGPETIVEVKCPYSSRYSSIEPETVPYIYFNNGELSLKKNNVYYYQVQGQLYVTGRKYCNFIIFTFKSLKVLFVERDDQFIEEMIRNDLPLRLWCGIENFELPGLSRGIHDLVSHSTFNYVQCRDLTHLYTSRHLDTNDINSPKWSDCIFFRCGLAINSPNLFSSIPIPVHAWLQWTRKVDSDIIVSTRSDYGIVSAGWEAQHTVTESVDSAVRPLIAATLDYQKSRPMVFYSFGLAGSGGINMSVDNWQAMSGYFSHHDMYTDHFSSEVLCVSSKYHYKSTKSAGEYAIINALVPLYNRPMPVIDTSPLLYPDPPTKSFLDQEDLTTQSGDGGTKMPSIKPESKADNPPVSAPSAPPPTQEAPDKTGIIPKASSQTEARTSPPEAEGGTKKAEQ